MVMGVLYAAGSQGRYMVDDFTAISILNQKIEKEKISKEKFRARDKNKVQVYQIFMNNYQDEIRGYVVESTQENIRVVSSRLLLDHPESISDRNSMVVSFSDIDYIQKASKRSLL